MTCTQEVLAVVGMSNKIIKDYQGSLTVRH